MANDAALISSKCAQECGHLLKHQLHAFESDLFKHWSQRRYYANRIPKLAVVLQKHSPRMPQLQPIEIDSPDVSPSVPARRLPNRSSSIIFLALASLSAFRLAWAATSSDQDSEVSGSTSVSGPCKRNNRVLFPKRKTCPTRSRRYRCAGALC